MLWIFTTKKKSPTHTHPFFGFYYFLTKKQTNKKKTFFFFENAPPSEKAKFESMLFWEKGNKGKNIFFPSSFFSKKPLTFLPMINTHTFNILLYPL